ncbi:unnamed protein product [Closterium sp. NIES-65]|nr:unnamed protein product [Closterium sp. NIES-65]
MLRCRFLCFIALPHCISHPLLPSPTSRSFPSVAGSHCAFLTAASLLFTTSPPPHPNTPTPISSLSCAITLTFFRVEQLSLFTSSLFSSTHMHTLTLHISTTPRLSPQPPPSTPSPLRPTFPFLYSSCSPSLPTVLPLLTSPHNQPSLPSLPSSPTPPSPPSLSSQIPRYAITNALLVAFTMTFFPIFDVPVVSSSLIPPFLPLPSHPPPPSLPTSSFRYAMTKAFLVAFTMTFFPIFDVPVFPPFLPPPLFSPPPSPPLHRYAMTKAFLVAFTMTFFPIFDVPVFWPILLMYWFTLFVLTMKRQIRHMIKYKYVPFSFGKQKYKGGKKPASKDDDAVPIVKTVSLPAKSKD